MHTRFRNVICSIHCIQDWVSGDFYIYGEKKFFLLYYMYQLYLYGQRKLYIKISYLMAYTFFMRYKYTFILQHVIDIKTVNFTTFAHSTQKLDALKFCCAAPKTNFSVPRQLWEHNSQSHLGVHRYILQNHKNVIQSNRKWLREEERTRDQWHAWFHIKKQLHRVDDGMEKKKHQMLSIYAYTQRTASAKYGNFGCWFFT